MFDVKEPLFQSFLSLVRVGIGHDCAVLPESMSWYNLQALAERQGLSAIVLDGLDRLVREGRMPKGWNINVEFQRTWIGSMIQYESRYERYRHAISTLAGFYASHGLKMMILKGYACSLDWPMPSHRPSGDIDIWQFGEYQKGDAVLESELGVKVDNSHHHHTVFHWKGFMVENHYDFINVHHHRSSALMERTFKELGRDDSYSVEVEGERVYIPSPNLHALFLLRHALSHFASTEITLRQLLDWGFHVKAHGKEVDWDWLAGVLEEYGMTDIFRIFNAICIEDIGFEAGIFPEGEYDKALKDRVLADILSPEFNEEEPSGLIPRVAFKFRRWRTNGWKHRLCYKESMWSAFWSGVWNHLLKPSSV